MNDEHDIQPAGPAKGPAADEPSNARPDIWEWMPIRVLTSIVAYSLPCLTVTMLVALIAVLAFGAASNGDFAGLLEKVREIGFQSLITCWLGVLVCFVMLNRFVLCDRYGLMRRSALLGAVSGLIAGLSPFLLPLFAKDLEVARGLAQATQYVVGAIVGLIGISWIARQRSASDETQPG